jgi:Flp pilus assembly protein TadB
MQDFDALKNVWQQSAGTAEVKPEITTIINNTTTSKMKLQKTQLHGTIMLTLTTVLIICLAVFGNLHFTHWYTYGGMALIAVICLIQAAFMYMTYKKLKRIDDTVEPSAHLRQWEAYYDLRKKQNRWNMPVYYVALNIAMAIYMVEIFTGRPVVNVMIFIAVYAAWMLFAYFYLGKKNIKREDARLQKVINELKTIEGQLSKAE